MDVCRVCNDELIVGKNWMASGKKRRDYTCRKCYAKKVREKRRLEGSKEQSRFKMTCIECGVHLIEGINWYKPPNSRPCYRCKTCLSKYQKEWSQTSNGKKLRRATMKRFRQTVHGKELILFHKRTLGYVPMNEPFGGCHSHHIDFENVIHIPKEWNYSVPHNVRTGKGMESINAMAYFFLMQQNIKELNSIFTKN